MAKEDLQSNPISHAADEAKSGERDANSPCPLELPPRKVKFQPGEEREFIFGRRRYHLERMGKSCWIMAAHKFPGVPLPEGEEPEPTFNNRFATNGSQDTVELSLGGSINPLLVKFQKGGVTIFPGDHATLIFMAPVFLRAVLVGHEKYPLHDGPCRSMSKAWSGTNLAGREAHEWKTLLLWEPPTDPPGNDQWDLACCTVEIHNLQDNPLKFDRLTVNLDTSPIFKGEGRLWTGLIKVKDHGGARGTEVTQTGKVPDFAGKVEQVYPPRTTTTSSGGLVHLSLGSLVGGLRA